MNNPKLSDFLLDDNTIKKYEVDLHNGIIKADNAEDHLRALEAVDKMGVFLQQSPSAQQEKMVEQMKAMVPVAPVIVKSPKMAEVVDMWLAERAKKNAERTITAKRYHMADFMRRTKSDGEINTINKATVVSYKTALLDEGQTGKTIDNKLLTLMDFFKYALNHGIYTISNSNPVDGLFVLTKAERVAKNEPYEAFEPDELKTLFEPSAYLEHMNAPDLFWAPLVGLYTGMRISEAAQMGCDDIKIAENGVDYIFVPKSKNTAGIRKVPIASVLIELGFLEYVKEVRASGAKRLFPHRSFVNGTYSKRLSEEMLKYQKARGIKEVDDRKSFHSFRVNVITELANKGSNTIQVMKIVGHKNGEQGIEVHAGYVRDLPDLKKIVDLLSWPVDIQALKYQGQFQAFVSDPKNWAISKKPRKKTSAAKVKAAAQ